MPKPLGDDKELARLLDGYDFDLLTSTNEAGRIKAREFLLARLEHWLTEPDGSLVSPRETDHE